MTLTSDAFKDNASYPVFYSCNGQNVNPPLTIRDIPARTTSLALTVVDPDAPGGSFVHWVVFDIAVTDKIKENSVPGKQGMNDAGGVGWVSPCPPSGTHRYIFTVYALDTQLGLNERVTLRELGYALNGHILAQATLTGLYSR